ncbi:hypothetical protein [Nafulsella turpanensis]|uniref:hypothetical protein n=1 Tax=Nafulsella turpanensis TaxID=1265690 RepID=UPI00034662F3|nr:hypothetical protein [Nafulsella turpanensis]
MKFRKEVAFWAVLFFLSLLAFYKLVRYKSSTSGRRKGFSGTIFSFLTALLAALTLSVFFLLVRVIKRGKTSTSFRDIIAAWLFSSGSIAGWGILRMFLSKQPYRYSSLWGALSGIFALVLLWQLFGTKPPEEEYVEKDPKEKNQ